MWVQILPLTPFHMLPSSNRQESSFIHCISWETLALIKVRVLAEVPSFE
jgi:hypothetical protein